MDQKLALRGASNDHVVDVSGRTYFDLTSGWNVTNAGWNNEAIFDDWIEIAKRLPFRPSWCTDESRIALTDLLETRLPNYFPIYSCSGSEAIDNALKVARLATGKPGVACISDAYHGSTLGAALASGFSVSHLEPLGLESHRITLPLPLSEEALTTIQEALIREEDIGAVVFETVLTNAGCHVVSDRFLELLQRLSADLGFLLVCDEIGTGMNRTGELWSFEARGIRPHIVTCGKALTNGLYPLSIALVSTELRPFVDEPSFASTYGGTPAACAAALSTIAYHEKSVLGLRALALGRTAINQLEKLGRSLGSPLATQGAGLSLAVELWSTSAKCKPPPHMPEMIIRSLLEHSIFSTLSADGTQLMITPPLTAEEDSLTQALDVVARVIIGMRRANHFD